MNASDRITGLIARCDQLQADFDQLRRQQAVIMAVLFALVVIVEVRAR